MKRICFLIGDITRSGGTERVTTLIANELTNRKKNVCILSLWGKGDPFFSLSSSVKTYSIFESKVSGKMNFFNYIFYIRRFIKKNKIDTLIVVDSISCIYTVPALWGLNIQHICWEHFNFNNNLGVKLRDFGRKFAAKYCDYVVVLTEKDKILWEKGLNLIKAKIRVIANPAPFLNIKNYPSSQYKIILAIGKLTYVKGFDLLLEAWSIVCKENFDWKLQIIGSGEEENNLKKQALELGINNRVDFIAETKNIDLYYRCSSLYCMSSRNEGFPMVLLEAQAYGIPIIAYDCDTGPADIVYNSKLGCLVKEINEVSLANSILYAMQMNWDYKYIKSVVNKYRIDSIVEKWEKII